MEETHSWEANKSSCSQQTPWISWHPYIHGRIHTSLPPVPILCQINPVHAPPHPTSWRYIVTLSSHLCLGLPSGLFPSDLPTKTLHVPPQAPICATCPAHLFLLDYLTQIIFSEQYGSYSSSMCSLLRSLVILSLSGPNILLSTLLSNTLSLCSSLHVTDQVSNPYKTKGKIIVLNILTFIYLVANCNTKHSVPHDSKHYLTWVSS